MIAQVLDYHQSTLGILGTIAGDDTIFVTPVSIKQTQKLSEGIKKVFNSSY